MASVKGGDRVREILQDIASKITKPAKLRVGFLENATYPDGTPVAMIGAIHNYGAPRAGIPPRPYFSNMIADKQEEWGPAIADLLKANDYDLEKVFKIVGHAITGQLREEIIKTNSPPLKEATIRAKGFAKPLIETSHMIKSADSEVKT